MRISTNQRYDAYTRNVRVAEQRLFESQQQMTTGKRINRASDDPFGAGKAIHTRSLKAALAQYGENALSAKGALGFTEQALAESSSLMQRAYSIAIQGGTATTDQATRTTMAAEIEDIQRRLVSLGNTKGPEGDYLFAGHATDTKPFLTANGSLTYAGDDNVVLAEVGPGEVMAKNTQGRQMFSEAFATLETLRVNLQGGNAGQVLDTGIKAAQDSARQFDVARGSIGARLRRVEELSNQNARRTDELATQLSDIEEVDLSQAVTQYKLAESAYQAALTVAAKGFELSLMDYIR